MQQLKVNPIDSASLEDLTKNIEVNLELIDTWVEQCLPHDEEAWIMSAGPSLLKRFEDGTLDPAAFKRNNKTRKVFCIKHALPILKKVGIVPYACVVLDPREIKGVSTHGFIRETLYSAANKSTIFLVASMTHPSVTHWLIDNGYKVVGWHASVKGLDKFVTDVNFSVSGGTCSATRTIVLSNILGFQRARLVGFDSSLEKKPTEKGAKEQGGKAKYLKVAVRDREEPKRMRKYWTTGELIAQTQDLERMLKDPKLVSEIVFIGLDKEESLMGAVADLVPNKTLKPYLDPFLAPNYKEVLGTK